MNCSQTIGEWLDSSVASHGERVHRGAGARARGDNSGGGGVLATVVGGGGVLQPLRIVLHAISISL